MNCDDFKKEISLELTGRDFQLLPNLKKHLENCDSCSQWYRDLSAVRDTLNSRSFEISPGELDDLTFEKIIAGDSSKAQNRGFLEILLPAVRKWAWVPAAAAAIAITLLLLPNSPTVPVDDEVIITQSSGTDWSLISEAADSGMWSMIVGSLVDDNSDFDLVAEELSRELNFEDELSGLSDDELRALYDNIDQLEGSAL